MKILLVPWLLFLVDASLSSGHYIRQTEDSKTDVYDIKDGSLKVSFVNPKPGKPTLREILYYHVIERERGDSPVTERSFTNGHGYQFLDPTTEDPEDQDYEKEEPEEYLREGEEQEQEEHEVVDEPEEEVEDTENHDEEDYEASTTQKPLTYEDVKEAYKARSYLFDQMRQRYAVKRMADSLHRKKRQAEMQIPEAPKLDADSAAPPNTYGMNVNNEGGYVWNNINKPNSYYELGASNGNPTEGQSESQSQENINNENGENSGSTDDDDDLADICVGIKPCARAGLQARSINDDADEDSKPINENTDDDNYPVAPGNESNDNPDVNNDNPAEAQVPKSLESVDLESTYNRTYGMSLNSGRGHVWNDLVNPPVSYEVGSSNDNAEPINVNQGPNGETESNESTYSLNPEIVEPEPSESEGAVGAGYEVGPEAPKPESTPDESPEGDKTTFEQTDNPYTNPQLNPEEKKEMEDKMEGIFATVQPVEDIPKTYGMNLTKDGGHVWNTLVNPPVSYNVGAANGNSEPSNENPEISEIPEPTNGASPDEAVIAVSNSGSNEEDNGSVVSNPEPADDNSGAVEDANSDTSGTYGMNLDASNAGQVWNGMVNPPVSYDVGSSSENPEPNDGAYPVEPVISSETNEPSNDGTGTAPEAAETPKPVEAVVNPGPIEIPPTESEGTNESGYEGPKEEDASEGEKLWVIPEAPTLPPLNYDGLPDYIRQVLSSTDKPASYEQPDNEYNPGIHAEDQKPTEDKEPEDVPNTYGMDLNGDSGHVWNGLVTPPVSYDVGSSSTEEEHKEPTPTETQGSEENPIPEPVEPIPSEEVPDETGPQIDENEEENKEPAGPLEPEPSEEVNPEEKPEGGDNNEGSEESQDNVGEQEKEPTELKPEENLKPDIMSELLKSEQFWSWLGKWTATYMELLEKHIRKIAIQEICNREKSGNQVCPLSESSEEIVVKDEKLVVEEKEKEVETNADEEDGDIELKKDHSHSNAKKHNGNKIEASTIYGNSVGNEKVTNVFIFTADKADEVIDKLKPANDSDIDFIIDERIKEEGKKETAPEDGEASKKKPEEGDGIEDELNKDDVVKEEPSGAETGTEELNSGDANNEESDNSNPNEEKDDKQEANKEESSEGTNNEENLNKEEPNEDESNKDDLNKDSSDAKEEELSKEQSGNQETSEGDENNEEAIKEEPNKQETKEESNEGDAKEELDKQTNASEKQLNKEAAEKEQSSEGGGNNEEITKEESKEIKDANKEQPSEGGANEEVNKDEVEKKDSEKETEVSEVTKDSENKDPKDAGDELKSSEKI